MANGRFDGDADVFTSHRLIGSHQDCFDGLEKPTARRMLTARGPTQGHITGLQAGKLRDQMAERLLYLLV